MVQGAANESCRLPTLQPSAPLRGSSLPQSDATMLDQPRDTTGSVLTVQRLKDEILAKLIYQVGKDIPTANARDWFVATAFATRDRIVDCWMDATRRTNAAGGKRVYYLSVEFLIGRLLFDGLGNLGLTDPVRQALNELGVDLDALRAIEPDAALGNGGLGRLAACFMDSMASIGLPAYGYGIRYDYGLFRQTIADGWQRETPENWLELGNPWEFERSEVVYPIGFGGYVEYLGGDGETPRAIWHTSETVLAVAYDTPVIGWKGRHANTLRLWSARATEPIELNAFNQGDHLGALARQARAEAISRVLYPSDETAAGQELRLRQEFFFTSASLQDLIRRHIARFGTVTNLAEHAAIHMNDTHPTIAVAELMRLLFDEHEVSWSEAWRITTATLNYTNHTLLPEALETWPLSLMNQLLPRHMQIIFLINHLHLRKLPEGLEDAHKARLSIIDESHGRRVRMGHLAFIGSKHINGVSALHTDLMRQTTFRDLNEVYPGRILNKTNGITFRRWLHDANPGLCAVLDTTIGPQFRNDPKHLTQLLPFANDAEVLGRLRQVKRRNKEQLGALIKGRIGVDIDPDALFDVQIKRIHEYKRQLLNILETVALYLELRENPNADYVPRVKIFAGKSAASYVRAKLIIKLANDVARTVNADPRIGDRLKVAFLANYNVSLAEIIVPAADLSEQISTAGLEASGTGNMKLALNGALTIGTLDGANVEISEAVGLDNIFIFGMKTPEVEAKRADGFRGRQAVAGSPRLAAVLDVIGDGLFSREDRERYRSLVDAVLGYDTFMVAADFDTYWAEQRRVDAQWRDQEGWTRKSALNIGNMAWFSSDRTIEEYAREIWNAPTLS
jgi:starch phosphorylase